MPNDIETTRDPSVTALVTGIIGDAQDLFKQQLELVRAEINSDFRKTKAAAQVFALGVGAGAVAVLLLSFMLVHVLQWATKLTIWSCYGIVGGVLGVFACFLCFMAANKFQSFDPLPDESFDALKETLQWKTNPR